MRIAHNVRLAAILAVGAFALHQLRYLIAFDPASLGEQGHGYMMDLLPPIAVLILAALLATVIRGTEGASPQPAPLVKRVSVFALALFAIYAGQETLEGLIATGHSAGLAGAFAGGGWLAAPLAVGIGALAALVARALERFERVITAVHAEGPKRSRSPAVRGRALPARALNLATAPLAFGLARRPPPAAPA